MAVARWGVSLSGLNISIIHHHEEMTQAWPGGGGGGEGGHAMAAVTENLLQAIFSLMFN